MSDATFRKQVYLKIRVGRSRQSSTLIFSFVGLLLQLFHFNPLETIGYALWVEKITLHLCITAA